MGASVAFRERIRRRDRCGSGFQRNPRAAGGLTPLLPRMYLILGREKSGGRYESYNKIVVDIYFELLFVTAPGGAENGTHPEAGSFDGCAWAGFWGRGPHLAGSVTVMTPGVVVAVVAVVTVATIAVAIPISVVLAAHIDASPEVVIAIVSAIDPAARHPIGAIVVARRPFVADARAGRIAATTGAPMPT